MQISDFIAQLKNSPESISFQDTMACIEANYTFTPTEFANGQLINQSGQNSGSCKLFSFAKLQNLNEQDTLNCFGDYYRKDVLEHPNAEDHQNIRNFMQTGWRGIAFTANALAEK